jgi:hypothetical protein
MRVQVRAPGHKLAPDAEVPHCKTHTAPRPRAAPGATRRSAPRPPPQTTGAGRPAACCPGTARRWSRDRQGLQSPLPLRASLRPALRLRRAVRQPRRQCMPRWCPLLRCRPLPSPRCVRCLRSANPPACHAGRSQESPARSFPPRLDSASAAFSISGWTRSSEPLRRHPRRDTPASAAASPPASPPAPESPRCASRALRPAPPLRRPRPRPPARAPAALVRQRGY